jgi:phosphate starvation-inducible PhoH-like protein
MMTEKEILLEMYDTVDVLGVNDANIEMFKKHYPKLKVVSRGGTVKLIGEENEIKSFEKKFRALLFHYEKFGNISHKFISELLNDQEGEFNDENHDSSVLLHGRNGMVIKAKSANQQRMVDSIAVNDLLFAVGPAGSGKTYTAVAIAVRALKNKEIRRIVLTRPAVEAGENLGFLPGDLKDKLDPYLQPLYDALWDMVPAQKLDNYIADGTIEIAPLAFMRGRTLDHAFVILDEAQNATVSQMKMFLTRMGRNAKFIVTGDITQVDLPRSQKSGLINSMDILKGIKGLDFVILDNSDIIRHKLVSEIITAYSNAENQ